MYLKEIFDNVTERINYNEHGSYNIWMQVKYSVNTVLFNTYEFRILITALYKTENTVPLQRTTTTTVNTTTTITSTTK